MYSNMPRDLDQCPSCGGTEVRIRRSMAPDSIVNCAHCESALCKLYELQTSIAETAHLKMAEAMSMPKS
ncbi:hypothetical protein BH688_14750 [Kushneria phosphatilytica]|nr:hypothetical protein BH688_14750 [Kushneria phosphatilytica]